MNDVNMKHVAMIKSGITPRALETCRTRPRVKALAELKGWPEADVLSFAKEIGIFDSKGGK